MKRFLAFVIFFLVTATSYAQTCTANASGAGSSTFTASTITWVSSGGATCPPTSTFTGNVVVTVGGNDTFTWNYPLNMTGDMTITLDNGANFIFSADVNVTGNVPLTNNGTSTLTINSGADIHVTGNMGDPTNNNVNVVVNGTLQVDGTLSGKNGNGFTGTGTISGGSFEIGTGATCGSPCPLTAGSGFTNCTSAGTVNGTFCTTYSVQPIELLYFKVSIPEKEDRSLIEWATSMEEDFDHFEIQRAGKDLEFSTILEVPGAGYNTNDIQKYTACDENPLVGIGYYRLKAVDIDGSVEYFSVKSVNYNGGRKLLVSPNPVSSSAIKYSINFEPGAYDRVSLINQVGTELFSAPVSAIENELVLDSKINPGAYFLRYSSTNFQYVARVFIKD